MFAGNSVSSVRTAAAVPDAGGLAGADGALRCRNQTRLVAIDCCTILVGQSSEHRRRQRDTDTGLPPLVSYGGNSLMSSLVILGLLVRCSLESTGMIGGRERQAR